MTNPLIKADMFEYGFTPYTGKKASPSTLKRYVKMRKKMYQSGHFDDLAYNTIIISKHSPAMWQQLMEVATANVEYGICICSGGATLINSEFDKCANSHIVVCVYKLCLCDGGFDGARAWYGAVWGGVEWCGGL